MPWMISYHRTLVGVSAFHSPFKPSFLILITSAGLLLSLEAAEVISFLMVMVLAKGHAFLVLRQNNRETELQIKTLPV